MPVFQMNATWIDNGQSESITLLFFNAADLSGALSKAVDIANAMQNFSGLRMIDCRISVNPTVSFSQSTPTLSNRQRLTLWCESVLDPIQQKRGRYKIILYGPKAEILSTDHVEFNPSTSESQSFISTVLNKTCDLRGNAFVQVIKGIVTMIAQ